MRNGRSRRGESPRGLEVGRELLRHWQADSEVERASLSQFAFDPDAPAHHFHQAFADGESEARASKAPRHRSIGLAEGLEEFLHVGRRDADSGVAHGELQGNGRDWGLGISGVDAGRGDSATGTARR